MYFNNSIGTAKSYLKSMKNTFIRMINGIDRFVSCAFVRLSLERKSLMNFLFHGICTDPKEKEYNIVDPTFVVTYSQLCQFIDYFLIHNYNFITPEDILYGLDERKNYILLTFDDGYYNNSFTLPILQKYNVPATFFISSNHVEENKSFWWDVIFRERFKRKTPIELINKEILAQEYKTNDEIDQHIIKEFGVNAFNPTCDLDRPFSPSELVSFSNNPLVTLGNHTSNHAVLTNYNPDGVRNEIENCQKYLYDLTGLAPIIISYPCGWYSKEIVDIAIENSIKLGLTVNSSKNYFPFRSIESDLLLLNRFTFMGNRNTNKQCASFRTDVHIKRTIKNLIKRMNK